MFVKWVQPDGHSPGLGYANRVAYPKGAEVVEPLADDDPGLDCAPGLHVLPVGVLPEHVGLAKPGHDLIPKRVVVDVDDIIFAGHPGMAGKLRVRRIVRVLD